MKIRIQPQDIDVPQSDPFENDLLDRKEQVEVLTHIIRSIEGPCTLAIDAPWGAGKTTFIKMWTQHLRNNEFPVVSFNAWETDFSHDPFIALSEELSEGLKQYKEGSLGTKIENVRQVSAEVARRSLPGLIRLGTAGVLDINPLMEEEAGKILASAVQDKLSAHLATQKSLNSFRTTLQDMADTLADANEGLPLVVIIDELDRCRPSYAAELLEVAKHLFVVNNIVFVLAVNRSELAHSICALYGNSFDALGYLKRFFDIDFRLPDPQRKQYIEATLESLQVLSYFERTVDREAASDFHGMQNMLMMFFDTPQLSIRTIGQAMHRLGLLLASMRNDLRTLGLAAVVVLIVRTVDLDLYLRMIQGRVTDADVVDSIFCQISNIDSRNDHTARLFEAIIIQGIREIYYELRHGNVDVGSPLIERYEKVVELHQSSDRTDRKYLHAQAVIEMASVFADGYPYMKVLGLPQAVRRLELLTKDLVDDV